MNNWIIVIIVSFVFTVLWGILGIFFPPQYYDCSDFFRSCGYKILPWWFPLWIALTSLGSLTFLVSFCLACRHSGQQRSYAQQILPPQQFLVQPPVLPSIGTFPTPPQNIELTNLQGQVFYLQNRVQELEFAMAGSSESQEQISEVVSERPLPALPPSYK